MASTTGQNFNIVPYGRIIFLICSPLKAMNHLFANLASFLQNIFFFFVLI